MIVLAIGANLSTARFGPPAAACAAALARLGAAGIRVAALSSWYTSPPDPPSDQPWFVNGAARIETGLGPEALLDCLHEIEAGMGRVRRRRNEPRIIDLDLVDYEGRVAPAPARPELPHPRLAERPFVLVPLAQIAPGWRDPRTGRPVEALIQALPAGAVLRPLPMA